MEVDSVIVKNNWQVPLADIFQQVRAAYGADDQAVLEQDLALAQLTLDETSQVQSLGRRWLKELRNPQSEQSSFAALMQQYNLSHPEGVLMMCLAEALLRIPDAATVDLLLSDKLSLAKWQDFLGKSQQWTVNLATWGLWLGRGVMGQPQRHPQQLGDYAQATLTRLGAPVVRRVVLALMEQLAQQFILGRDMPAALKKAQVRLKKHSSSCYSFDMLGEAARTDVDAEHYFQQYKDALQALAVYSMTAADMAPSAQLTLLPTTALKQSLSIKLSAIYPRYEMAKREQAVAVISERLLTLAKMARDAGLQLTIDAEECARLELSLEIFYEVYTHSALGDWDGLGLAVQCYQKRALPLLKWLVAIAQQQHKKIPIRLVKGAYWDSEIKLAQQLGLKRYPVFSRKPVVDLVYLAAARYMLQHDTEIIPQFATHNVHSAAAVIAMAGNRELEFQQLHGMGDELHALICAHAPARIRSRIYAPVGVHRDLLPYLVRRLLENGANSSFLQQLAQAELSDAQLLEHPIVALGKDKKWHHDAIPLPPDLFGKQRKNALGLDLNDVPTLEKIQQQWQQLHDKQWSYSAWQYKTAIIKAQHSALQLLMSFNPAQMQQKIGDVAEQDVMQLPALMDALDQGYVQWSKKSVDARAAVLNTFADLLEQHILELMYLINQEAGRTLADTLSEVREAIDFCRYYAAMAKQTLSTVMLAGPTGEDNQLSMHGRGVIACISPWNFPLAIFCGQLAAAIVAGNSVLAKPASLTPCIAARAVQLAYAAGVPHNVLQLAVCGGAAFSRHVLSHAALAGVMLTGSNATADAIAKGLAARGGPSLPFIAETGGMNAMLVDSSAFIEHVVDDVMESAFGSAGQRCSSLRVLCLQEDIADVVLQMLCGAMQTLVVGDPAQLTTDIGPLISTAAWTDAAQYIKKMYEDAQCAMPAVKLIYPEKAMPEIMTAQQPNSLFLTPHIFQINDLAQMQREVFAPVLHVYRYKRSNLDQVIKAINAWGYGLTCGIHSRIAYQVDYMQQRLRVGNIYVNRNMIGAVVGCQPFGGLALSGTGPKAGGPHYLSRLCYEQTRCVNTAAVGGDAALLSLA